MNAQATDANDLSPSLVESEICFEDSSQNRLIEHLPTLSWTLSPHGAIVSANHYWNELTDDHESNSAHKYWWDFIDPDQQNEAKESWIESNASKSVFEMHCRLRDYRGRYEWYLIRVAPPESQPTERTISLEIPAVRYAICTNVQKIYDSFDKFIEKSRIESDMLNASVDCIKMLNLDGTLQRMNRSGCIALGIDEKSRFGMKWVDLVPSSMKRRVRRAIAVAATGKRARFSGSTQIPGRPIQHWDNILTPVLDDDGQPMAILCVSREITLQRAAENRLRAASERDPLTGLLNRKSFRNRTNRWLMKARQTGESLALILVDLDHLKSVNDCYGHPEGDYLIREIAKRLEKSFQGNGIVSRLGGDEFAIVLKNISSDPVQLTNDLKKAFAKISNQVVHGGRQINGGMSVGVSLFPKDAGDLTDWMRKADVALTDTKSNFKGSLQLFHEAMSQKNFCSLGQLNAVRSLLNSSSFEVQYRKQSLLHSMGDICGYSAELRLKLDVQELLGIIPTDILRANHTVANESAALLRQLVICDIAKCIKKSKTLVPVSVQFPIGELMREQFAAELIESLNKQNVAPYLLKIVVHETVFQSRSAELVIRTLRELNRSGFEICLGEFGEGSISLQHLPDYPIHEIQITNQLTDRYLTDPKSAAIVRSTCQLCRELQLKVSAQGIDSLELANALQKAGCQYGTGTFIDSLKTNKQ